nr:MAG TPA_asm: hypothetical protein [Caudoviricetes sp.]
MAVRAPKIESIKVFSVRWLMNVLGNTSQSSHGEPRR